MEKRSGTEGGVQGKEGDMKPPMVDWLFHRGNSIPPNEKVEDEPYSETEWDSVSDWPEDVREWLPAVQPRRGFDGE